MFSTTVKAELITRYLCTLNPAYSLWESRSLFAIAYSIATNNYFMQHSAFILRLETGYKKQNTIGNAFSKASRKIMLFKVTHLFL